MNRYLRPLAALALVLTLTGCDLASYGVTLLNYDRVANCGRSPLAVDQSLRAEAQRRSDQLANDGYLHHTSDQWSGVPAFYSIVGENVGVSFQPNPIVGLLSLTQSFAWSPAHQARICSGWYSHIGYGFTARVNQEWVVEVFAG